jgi:hypothetical protein
MSEIIMTGDVNLMNVTDPQVPFRRVHDIFLKADVVFSNFETSSLSGTLTALVNSLIVYMICQRGQL